jgi:hypothetical protein
MWPLPEPARPEEAERWDPPVLVRLALDHGCDDGRTDRAGHAGPDARERPGPPPGQPRPAPWGTRAVSRRP